MAKELTTLLIVAVVMIVLLTGVLYFLPCGTTIEKFAAAPALTVNETKIGNEVGAYLRANGVKVLNTQIGKDALLKNLKNKKLVPATTTIAQITQQINKPKVFELVLSKLTPAQLAVFKADMAAKKAPAKSVTLANSPVYNAAIIVAKAANPAPAAIAKAQAEAVKFLATNPIKPLTPAAMAGPNRTALVVAADKLKNSRTAAETFIAAKTPAQIKTAAAKLAAATISQNAPAAVKAAAAKLAVATTPAQVKAAALKLKAVKANAAVKPAVKKVANKIAKANTPVKAATAAAQAAKVIKTTPATKGAVTAAVNKLSASSSHIEAKVAGANLVAASAAKAADAPAIKTATASLAVATTPAQAKAAITKLVAATSPAVATKPAVKAAIMKLAAAKTPAQVKVASTQLAAATTAAKSKAAANPSFAYGMNGVLTDEQCSTLCPVDFTQNSLTGIPVGAIQRTVSTIRAASKNSPLANVNTLEKAYVTPKIAGFQDYIAHDIHEDFEDEDFENEEGFADMSDDDDDDEDNFEDYAEGFADMNDDDDDDDDFEDYEGFANPGDEENFENYVEGFKLTAEEKAAKKAAKEAEKAAWEAATAAARAAADAAYEEAIKAGTPAAAAEKVARAAAQAAAIKAGVPDKSAAGVAATAADQTRGAWLRRLTAAAAGVAAKAAAEAAPSKAAVKPAARAAAIKAGATPVEAEELSNIAESWSKEALAARARIVYNDTFDRYIAAHLSENVARNEASKAYATLYANYNL